MERHVFHMRLACTYKEDDNQVDSISVEHLENNEWNAFDLNATTPGFLIFTYAVFTCQHMFMRVNAAERNLILDNSSGSIMIDSSPDWHIEKLHVNFDARLRAGSASQDDIEFITGRMHQCPVSKNLAPIPDAKAALKFS